jgi:hypothetical protein
LVAGSGVAASASGEAEASVGVTVKCGRRKKIRWGERFDLGLPYYI